jgi:hypothetical protein
MPITEWDEVSTELEPHAEMTKNIRATDAPKGGLAELRSGGSATFKSPSQPGSIPYTKLSIETMEFRLLLLESDKDETPISCSLETSNLI